MAKRFTGRPNRVTNKTGTYPTWTMDLKTGQVSVKREPGFIQDRNDRKYPSQIRVK